jgi:protein O-GlcNAc transferase
VDLAGHTSHNRLGVFARKPAPLLVSWLGYFNTTGLDSFDYFLTDPWSSPPGQETYFVEQLLRLPHTRFCYEPWEFVPEVNALPALERGHVTFGCFNNLSKLNDRVLALWARVLQAVPGSRLVIQAQSLNDIPNRERFAQLAVSLGIARERLELREFMPLDQAALAYHGIDIALDPFPFSGGMTSFEALWMGVPVVTLEQPLIAGRQTLSMLHNLGLPELVAKSEQDYVAITAGLAGDPQNLAALRAGLRPRFAASPLADYDAFARDLATAFRGMWRNWVERA